MDKDLINRRLSEEGGTRVRQYRQFPSVLVARRQRRLADLREVSKQHFTM